MKCRLFLAVGSVICSSHASAQALDAEPVSKQMDFMEIVFAGGPMMYPLALLSMVGVVLVLIYLLTIRRNAVVSDRFMDAAEAMIRKRDYLGLVAYCHRQNECMARVTQKTLDFLTKYPAASFGGVREVAEAEGSRQAGLLTSRITYLADIGSIAPMVGLLGTVLGMIKSFLQISSGDVTGVRQMQLAEGVSEALITTAAGLMIGIPALGFLLGFPRAGSEIHRRAGGRRHPLDGPASLAGRAPGPVSRLHALAARARGLRDARSLSHRR